MSSIRLTTAQMAHFAARGFLRLNVTIPDAINQRFLNDIGTLSPEPTHIRAQYKHLMQSSVIPLVPAGTPISEGYPKDSAMAQVLQVPEVAGAIESLVGPQCVIDHHFLHVTLPASASESKQQRRSQHTHQDSTIDPRNAFDIQMFYFPHEVTADMGGTRFIPGTHFRVVSEAAIGRYQNILGQKHVVCPAGSIYFFHMGLWHGAGLNQSEHMRTVFKIRLCPTQKQERLWEAHDVSPGPNPRPIFWTDGTQDATQLETVLMTPEPWFEADTGRLEYLNRIRFWRYITGDDTYDADYWLTRIENEYA